MHGILFTELRKYVGIKFGHDSWMAMLDNAGLGKKTYMPFQAYPDADMIALVTAASRMTGRPVQAILEDYGEFIAPDLFIMYQSLIKPQWRTLDVLEHIETTIHTVVREQNPEATPPALVCKRPSSEEVVITYTSARKLCAVAKGIIRGLAKWYKEEVTISESSCMLEGGSACIISVKLVN
jgi:predicted hydrocarbon binding protein